MVNSPFYQAENKNYNPKMDRPLSPIMSDDEGDDKN
jgi:hypothetical protein